MLYGRHAVLAALENPARPKRRLIGSKASLAELTLPADLPVETLERDALARRLGEESVHQGLALEVEPLEPPSLEEVIAALPPEGHVTLLALDQVTDPHNVGAILRSARPSAPRR